ncbi:MAG: FprA family A-type flavoprotein [Bacteroidales bacterium]|nr:FprA family A-type flavoprotein [Bacteroidales bacterium]
MKDDKIIKIADHVSWIGILDYDIVSFDIVMETLYGTTYNSYFIDAGKKVIIDTSKARFEETYLNKVKKVCNPEEIDFIVLNHTEPDHSGNLGALLELAPNATVVGSGQALNYISEITDKKFKTLKVKDGDTIDLGNKTLKIIGAPNLHWPDTIYTYLVEDRLLFTCDSFGAHYCSDKIFDDEIENHEEAFRYYFDVILKPFSKFMLKAIEKISDLDIAAICPGHGPVLRTNWKKYVDLSAEIATKYLETTQSAKNKVLLAYISAYGYTAGMADSIRTGLQETGNIEVEIADIENMLLGELEEKLVKADAVIIGSPTFNQNTLLPVYKFFSIVNPIRDKGKLAAAFGSYGWSGEAVKLIEDHLSNLKFRIALEGLSEKFNPYNGKAEKFREFGREFAKKLVESQGS